jgi:putative AdoMet-dependent methyltransferase
MASDYDRTVSEWAGFPFEDYTAVLDAVVQEAGVQEGMAVLDLGTGTGNLVERFVERRCDVWGIDFSEKMLAEAQKKLPGVRLIKADLLGEWPGVDRRFHRVVSSFTFHHFDLSTKVELVQKIVRDYLMAAGRIIIADIVFATREAHAEVKTRFPSVWDDSEHYWLADEAIDALTGLGFACSYKQVSACGGLFIVTDG